MVWFAGGKHLGGGRRSGAVGLGAREHGRGSCWWLRVRGDVLSTLVFSGTGCSDHGRVCFITGDEELTDLVELWPRQGNECISKVGMA